MVDDGGLYFSRQLISELVNLKILKPDKRHGRPLSQTLKTKHQTPNTKNQTLKTKPSLTLKRPARHNIMHQASEPKILVA